MKTQDLGGEEEVLRHDQTHDRMKGINVLCCLILLLSLQKNLSGTLHRQIYRQNLLCIGYFQPQGNDLARSLHRFAEGAAITDEKAKNWLGIAGNSWGMSNTVMKNVLRSKTEEKL